MYTAADVYGCTPQYATMGQAAVTQQMGTQADGLAGWQALVNPKNPLLWFGGILAATLGLAAVAGHVRVGPVSASAQIGKG